ncbi:(2Fe-2S)-binding protein [Pseudoalteromonas sp. DL2-H2.2]|uniref:2Fe-2S iron-sulfur cluster-binding protein n=1 Tax=Pseudoalteromonas sp. DL2-H2.2 TaxID=2908889 RepID=UPI001F318607|nr:2Fe-2S iron-sulfur cluster-binding protein [Pseudoalteromonas sp. DL2-H2.2]MCF2909888.1 (2Fe-2S)-binding protein [Pseudoalteromonas sp. DL2-H2.2]
MKSLKRTRDITPLPSRNFKITVDDQPVEACEGETVLSVLLAANYAKVMENDRNVASGAYCGMGVCHCCQVKINAKHKQRACQTLVEPQMSVETLTNRFKEEGIKHD